MTATTVPRTRHPLALRLQCRQEWVEGHGTLEEIARKHNVPPQTLVAWYRREYWSSSRRRWHAKQLSDNEPPAKPPCYTPDPKNTTNAHAEKQRRLELQLVAVDNLIDDALGRAKFADLQRLSAARKSLFEQWRILAGIPLPGSYRPKKPPERARDYGDIHPIPSIKPTVVAPVSEPVHLKPLS